MCKNTPLQHNGLDVTPEATLRVRPGASIRFCDRYAMQQLAVELGYPFYLHDGLVYSTQEGIVIIGAEDDVFQAALPACKGKSLGKPISMIPIAVAA